MISQIFISIIVFNFFGNVYTLNESETDEELMRKLIRFNKKNKATTVMVMKEHDGQNKSKEINLQEINEKLDHLTNQTTLLSCWAKSSIEKKIFWIESSNFIHKYTLDGGWTFGNYNRSNIDSIPMTIGTILNGCGTGKVHFGPYFHECNEMGEGDDCGVSQVTIKVNLDGKTIEEISDGRGGLKDNKNLKLKKAEFKFHPGSKIEFLITTTTKNGERNHYGAAIKFYVFQIVECSSKCE